MMANGKESVSYSITVSGILDSVSGVTSFILTILNPCAIATMTSIESPDSIPNITYTIDLRLE